MTTRNTTRKTTEQKIIERLARARHIRNPFVGKAHERFYLIDAATMRAVRKLAATK